LYFLAIASLLIACGSNPAPIAAPQGVPTATLPRPIVPAVPTALPAVQGAAARVNGQDISMTDFQKEVARTQAGQNIDPNSANGQAQLVQIRQQVLDTLIDNTLIAQAAAKEGVVVSDADVDAAMQQMISQVGGDAAFQQSLAAMGQTLDEARVLQKAGMLTNAMRDRVIANITNTAEQVHARHILVESDGTAQALLAQIQAGADFAQLAQQASQDNLTRDRGGDLDWFPRGWLPAKEVEDAAFALQPGQVSGVVQSAFGFHIIQVIERDPARALTDDQVRQLQMQAMDAWLAGLRAAAQVEMFVNP
jgi:parvulin-like peptidyl-prolyl isomerase